MWDPGEAVVDSWEIGNDVEGGVAGVEHVKRARTAQHRGKG